MAYVRSRERETVLVQKGKETLAQFPIKDIQGILCFGETAFSSGLLDLASEFNVNIACYSRDGKFRGRLQGRQTGNVLLRRRQFLLAADKVKSASVSRLIVAAKIVNCRHVLQRSQRTHGKDDAISRALDYLKSSLEKVAVVQPDPDAIRGLEGEAAREYFAVFDRLISPELRESFSFKGRNRRPPLDNVNALLSLVYTYLYHDISSALLGCGFDVQTGFLHGLRSGRDSLALDIMEDFRPWFADRLVLSLINRRQMQNKDFVKEASGAVRRQP